MSQAKVDKRKYEKIHRKEIERKRKISTAIKCVVAAVVVGVVIGVPAGLSIYNSIPRFVGDASLQAFVTSYFDDNYASDLQEMKERMTSTEAAAEETATEETTSEASSAAE